MNQEIDRQSEVQREEDSIEESTLRGTRDAKPNKSKIAIIIVVVVLVLVVAGVALALILVPNNDEKSNRKTNETSQKHGGSNKPSDGGSNGSSDGGNGEGGVNVVDDGTIEGKIGSIMASTKEIAKKYAANYDYAMTDVDDYVVEYEFEKGISTSLEKSIGFVIKPRVENDLKLADKMRDGITSNANLQKEIEEKMKSFGLTKSNNESGHDWYNARFYNDDGYLCVEGLASDFYIVCGHSSWLSDKTKSLVKALAYAYAKAEKVDFNNDGVFLYIRAVADDIKDSKTKPYQTIEVDFGDAGGYFYRKGEDSEWIYAGGGQQAPDCSYYDTDELKAAFEGFVCWYWEEDPPRQSTVKK